ncbi:hypothetical protein R5R35_001823 [Gryllus longicercus]|uniref:Uncharacterized protein n=1 Tax=Gryllus longicercus TaxID=2509291 RepID=A0AAN9WIL6_9ORTH
MPGQARLSRVCFEVQYGSALYPRTIWTAQGHPLLRFRHHFSFRRLILPQGITLLPLPPSTAWVKTIESPSVRLSEHGRLILEHR